MRFGGICGDSRNAPDFETQWGSIDFTAKARAIPKPGCGRENASIIPQYHAQHRVRFPPCLGPHWC
jgi:hypothetical protein